MARRGAVYSSAASTEAVRRERTPPTSVLAVRGRPVGRVSVHQRGPVRLRRPVHHACPCGLPAESGRAAHWRGAGACRPCAPGSCPRRRRQVPAAPVAAADIIRLTRASTCHGGARRHHHLSSQAREGEGTIHRGQARQLTPPTTRPGSGPGRVYSRWGPPRRACNIVRNAAYNLHPWM